MAPGRGVPVELDRERHIRYPMSAIKKIEERFDADLLAGTGAAPEDVEDVVWLIWLGLQHGEPTPEPVPPWTRALRWIQEKLGLRRPEPELTEDFVAQYVDLTNVFDVMGALDRAMGGDGQAGEVAPPEVGKGRRRAG